MLQPWAEISERLRRYSDRLFRAPVEIRFVYQGRRASRSYLAPLALHGANSETLRQSAHTSIQGVGSFG
jgi:hypothetical protein